ncbi:hypothetical protein [Streptomyces sp. Ru72]|uniref:Mu transposase domain-containing protein n=1 Tax=Streptomyces sp. Ru72 TaxID=2080747 RepID=UPI002156243F|nr:hypothetical protein [Streptomyces sp. Ru72]
MNRYSVPVRLIGRTVRVMLHASELVVYDGREEVARHERLWEAAVKAHGQRDGTRALTEVLLLSRHLPHEHLVTGLAAALQTGALTADAVALEARKAADADTGLEELPQPPSTTSQTAIAPLPAAVRANLPPDKRPLPSVAPYDQLLRLRRPDHPTP